MLPSARAPLDHHQHNNSNNSANHGASGGAATAAEAPTMTRQQWDARLASFQRGLDHVMHCTAGDACGSALCHATRRLMRNYATHDCTSPPGSSTSTTATECKVCKLWGYILTRNKPTMHTHGGRSTVGATRLPPISCGMASARRSTTARGRGLWSSSHNNARRAAMTPELIKAMAKRV